jgi:uncharacterized protein
MRLTYGEAAHIHHMIVIMSASDPDKPPIIPAASSAAGIVGLDGLMRALGGVPAGKLPPVERWNPPDCGDIDMEIRADGTWYYMGSPIGRMPMVKLFSSVLRLDGGRYVLVTPVEKVGIRVVDAPFQAVEMRIEGDGLERSMRFRTNVDDLIEVGPEHGLRFERTGHDGLTPYVHVRRGLWARVSRALTYDLLALGEVQSHDKTQNGAEEQMFGVHAGGLFHPAVPAMQIEGLL